MEKYIYYAGALLISIFVLGSCKLYQQKHQDELQSSGMEWQKNDLKRQIYALQHDSLSRWWYFWTDSSFYFHPDSGLVARAGTMLLQESQVNNHTEQLKTSGTSAAFVQNNMRTKQSGSSALRLDYLWILVAVLLGVFVLIKRRN